MSIRLIASDMDGTLLNPQANISKANADAIRRLDHTSVEFLICTGRDYQDARAIMESAGITCSYICLSGAAVYDQAGTLLKEIPLSRRNISDIERIFTEQHADMDILTSHGRYTTAAKDQKIKELYSFLNGGNGTPVFITEELEAAARERINFMTFIESIKDLPENETVFKICSNGILPEKVAELKKLFSNYPDLAAASSFPTNIELTNHAAQKGIALKAYADRKGIPLADVMVLGDSDNDLSMFTPDFGWTVAMANAMPCIRDAAKYHTKSNAEDGVAWAIGQYVFHE
ncbi:Cof-type HAD-IIB family hydrolase [Clostridium sp. Marseille-P2415]|uniref:Cof-type HAD-IIB family hydrolase n=1 Tax=Clostridium sp. Marseille-P2415 TaxID=1805471 RepID=UPI0009884B69|nr:Cof-type HAD-IIB family hydrolase [Clostridium sp. Marseille-P2415]